MVLNAWTMSKAEELFIQPPAAITLNGVPPIPIAIAADVKRYTDFKPARFASWHPQKLEMLIAQRHENTAQIHRLKSPSAKPELVTDYPEPVARALYQPTQGNYFLFAKDSGGNEVYRIYRYDMTNHQVTAVSRENKRAENLVWSKRGNRFLYTMVPVNRKQADDVVQTEVYIANPRKPGQDKLVALLGGGGWSGFTWSPDDKRLLYLQYISANESYIWSMDIASRKRTRLTDKRNGKPVMYAQAEFSSDGKGIYAITDRDSEFQRLVYIDLATRTHTVLSASISWNVEAFDLSRDGKSLAFISNEDGVDVLHIMRTHDRREIKVPHLASGSISSLRWHNNNTDLAFTISSAKHPSDVYSLNAKTGELVRWTHDTTVGIDYSAFVEPELIRWKSFDGRTISGFLYRAPANKFPGKRPVLINVHGGPEAQFQPGFLGRNNYYINELGIDVIFPNVRGSTGYGKTFLALDNGKLREDSVKDIGALFDWIATHEELDASRVMIAGGSYGGYVSLAVSTLYPNRIAGAIDIVGISNFVTFLERTEGYRRDLRRVEYGDERDPDMRDFLEEISPLNRAEQIAKPLFVVAGKNDPRVPIEEAEQIVAIMKDNGTPVWYLMAADEGHGFGKKINADFQFYATVMYLRHYLLGEP